MARPRRNPKQPRLLSPQNYNIGSRETLYRVYAQPLIPARAIGHPFRGRKVIDITSYVSTLSWSTSVEEAGAVAGTVQLKNPGNVLGILVAGSKIIIRARVPFIGALSGKEARNYRYTTILEMIVKEREKETTEFDLTLTVEDRLSYLKTGEHDFAYKKKKGKRGPTASFIIKDICRKKAIPFSKTSIPKTNVELSSVTQEKASILNFFVETLKKHNQAVDKKNGKRPAPPNWDIHMRTGILTITPKRQPSAVWLIDERYFVSSPSYRESAQEFATRVIVKGKTKTYKKKYNKDGTEAKKKKAVKKEIKVVRQDPEMIRVYGLIEKRVNLSGDITQEDAVKAANVELNKATQMQRELSFNCPALPNIWAGSKVYLHFPSYGMKGFFTVISVEYQVSGSDGPTMSVTVDAGKVSTIVEAAPRIITVKRAAVYKRDDLKRGIRAGRTVLVTWSDGTSVRYTHPNRYKVKSVQIVRSISVPEFDRPTKGETVVITYTQKKRGGKNFVSVRIPNRVTFGAGLVPVTQEGYLNEGG